MPEEVVIVISVLPGAVGSFTQPDFALNEPVTVGGFDGSRREQVGVWYESGDYEALLPSYSYGATLSNDQVEGPTMIASTSSDGHPAYVLNKAVLDRIMASISFVD